MKKNRFNTFRSSNGNYNNYNYFNGLVSLPTYGEEKPIVISSLQEVNSLKFNVLPNRPVTEDLIVNEYRIWNGRIEADMCRKYMSTMENSPDHFIFMNGLIHMQKMLYIYLCCSYGLDTDMQKGIEYFKLWPQDVYTKMPELYSKETATQIVNNIEIGQCKINSFWLSAKSNLDEAFVAKVRGKVFVMEGE